MGWFRWFSRSTQLDIMHRLKSLPTASSGMVDHLPGFQRATISTILASSLQRACVEIRAEMKSITGSGVSGKAKSCIENLSPTCISANDYSMAVLAATGSQAIRSY